MSDQGKGNAEQIVGAAISVPLNIIHGLADLLIAKGIISREEMVSLLQSLSAHASGRENEDMVRMMLEGVLTRYQKGPLPGSGH
jgi:hypothetical protein